MIYIGEAARRIGCTPEHLRNLEREGRVPAPARDYNGRIFTELDIALLKDLGVGSRPRKLKRPEEILTVDG